MTLDATLDRASWLASRNGHNRRSWSSSELEALQFMVGKRLPSEIARKLGRSRNSVMCKLGSMGYRAADHTHPIGLTGMEIARRMQIPYYQTVWRDIKRGILPAAKEGKKDFVILHRHIRRYETHIRLIQKQRERALARARGKTITKQEYMALIGLSETQATRYLQFGIVKAWKIPTRWVRSEPWRWEWRVSLASARKVKRLRESGKLQLRHKRYREQVQKQGEVIARVKKNRKERKVLRPRACVVPGCLTLSEVAKRAKRREETVYRHAREGRLKAKRVRVGRRYFLAIHPDSLPAYLASLHPGNWRKAIDEIHAAGRLTVAEAAREVGIEPGTLAGACYWGKVPFKKIGGMRAVLRQDVRRYVKGMKPRKGVRPNA